MVNNILNQNFVLYVNTKNILKVQNISIKYGATNEFAFCINEEHLIVGLIIQGRPIKGDSLTYIPLKPIEKYLFEFSNIHFVINRNDFAQENTCYNWNIDNKLLYLTPPVIGISNAGEWSVTISAYSEGSVLLHIPETNLFDNGFKMQHFNEFGNVVFEESIYLENLLFTMDGNIKVYNYYLSLSTGVFSLMAVTFDSTQVSNIYNIPF